MEHYFIDDLPQLNAQSLQHPFQLLHMDPKELSN